jgi:hypothetical protein
MRRTKIHLVAVVTSALCTLVVSDALAETAPVQIGVGVGAGAPSFDGGRSCVNSIVTRRASVSSTFAVDAYAEPMDIDEINRQFPGHHVSFHATIRGSIPTTVSGDLSGNTSSWKSSFSGAGVGDLVAEGEVFQYFRRRRYTVAVVTVPIRISFTTSAQIGQACGIFSPPTFQFSPPAFSVEAGRPVIHFRGFFFPNLHGPIVQRIRHRITQALNRSAAPKIQAAINSRSIPVHITLRTTASDIISQLSRQLPLGCGCGTSTGTLWSQAPR